MSPERSWNRLAVGHANSMEKLGAETAAGDMLGAEEGAVYAGPGVAKPHDGEEEIEEPLVAANRKPLNFMFVGIGIQPEQLGHPSVKVAQRIGIVMLLIECQTSAGRTPACTATEVAAAVERKYRRF